MTDNERTLVLALADRWVIEAEGRRLCHRRGLSQDPRVLAELAAAVNRARNQRDELRTVLAPAVVIV